MLIRESIEAGRIDEAVRRVNELDSEVSVDSIPSSSFSMSLWYDNDVQDDYDDDASFPMIKDFMHHA